MTVTSAISRNDYVGNGATSVFAYNFRIFVNTDLLVTVRDLANVETTLVLATDYTVSGVGNVNGGNVTLVNGGQAWLETDGDLLTGYALAIRRVRPVTQTTDIRNQGAFFPEIHEDSFDHGIMVSQQRQDEVDRSLKLPETEAGTAAKTTIPVSADRASKVLAFDASGNPVAQANVPTSGVTATAYIETLLDDTTAAAARTTLLVGPGEFSPASITTSQNNYDATGGGAMVALAVSRLTSSGAVNITGVTLGFTGARLTIINIGSNNITLTHQDSASLAANRMILQGSADLTLGASDQVDLAYDNTSSRWRQVA